MRAVHSLHRQVADDRGAMLIYVSVAVVALLSLTTLVVDYGIFWLARGQAQNAADAAAHAGAVSLAFENLSAADIGFRAAGLGNQNRIWGAAPSWANGTPTVQRCPNVAVGAPGCVQVDVEQTLPTVFGRLVGVTTQAVMATAIAEARPGNTARCLKPWAVPDMWTEVQGNTTYDKYTVVGNPAGTPIATPDLYTAPSPASAGTGYQPARDLGSQLTLQFPACTSAANCRLTEQTAGFLIPIDLVPSCGAFHYADAITGCDNQLCNLPTFTIGGTPLTAWQLSAGVKAETVAGANALIAADPAAVFDPTTKRVLGSCANPSAYSCLQPGLSESPRIVAIAAFSPTTYDDRIRGRSNAQVTLSQFNGALVVSNFLGIFIDHVDGAGNIVTYLVKKQGDLISGSPTVSGDSAFTSKVLIVR